MHSGNFLPPASQQVPDVYSHIPAISGQGFWLKLGYTTGRNLLNCVRDSWLLEIVRIMISKLF